jgi:hypothetical protein
MSDAMRSLPSFQSVFHNIIVHLFLLKHVARSFSRACSTDGREGEVLAYLEQAGVAFVYKRQAQNMRYDGSIRAAIGLASGRYCFLLGNDDALASPETLAYLHQKLIGFSGVAVAITNYEDFTSGLMAHRMKVDGLLGAGAETAVQYFRNFSFVSGVILDRERAQSHVTERWDGSEMYQMYIGSRMIAEGGQLLSITRSEIRKDIQIPGEQVDSISRRPRAPRWPIVERQLPLNQLGRLVIDAITPYVLPDERPIRSEQVLTQILLFTYSFWLFEYRRIQSWSYALGIALGMRPQHSWRGVQLGTLRQIRLRALYSGVTLLGLSLPQNLFRRLQRPLYSLSRAYRLRRRNMPIS